MSFGYSIIVSLFGVTLLVLAVVILVRKILIEFKGTDKGIINLIIIAFIVIGIICSFAALLGVINISSLVGTLNSKETLSMEKIEYIKREIVQIKNRNIIYLIVGYCSLAIDIMIFKNIEKKKKLDVQKGKNTWDWKKIK